MRLAFATVLALCGAVLAEAKQPGSVIISDIELSEWTPPMTLTIDLHNGSYSIEPPAAGWHARFTKPLPRRGIVARDKLIAVRVAFRDALAQGLADTKCVAANGKGYPRYLSNAGTPQMSILSGSRKLATASLYGCWTPAAMRLHKLLQRTFDRQNRR